MAWLGSRRFIDITQPARHVEYVAGEYLLEEARLHPGVRFARKRRPDVQATLRLLRLHSCGEMLGDRIGHRLGLGAITPLHLGQVFLEQAGSDRAADELLGQMARAEVMVALDPQHWRQQFLRQDAKPHAHAGGERLAVRARVNHAIGRALDGQGGRRRYTGKPQFAIGGVLHQVNRMTSRALVAAQQLQRALLHPQTGRAAGRVLVIRNEVQYFQPGQTTVALERLEHLLEMSEVNTIAVHPHATTGDTAALHDAEVNKIRRVLHQHDVARVAQRLGGHVEKLLRAVGDDRALGLVGRRLATGIAVELPDALGRQFAECGVTRRRAVLQRRFAKRRVSEQLVKQPTASRHRQRWVVSETGRERNQLGPLQFDAHQPRDRRLRHAPRHRRKRAWF